MMNEQLNELFDNVSNLEEYRKRMESQGIVLPLISTEKKEQMSVFLTPTDQRYLTIIAEMAGMNKSELIAYWIHMSMLQN